MQIIINKRLIEILCMVVCKSSYINVKKIIYVLMKINE